MHLIDAMDDRLKKADAPALPLVLVVGSRWSVYFLVGHEDHIVSPLPADSWSEGERVNRILTWYV
jgi:hypothetical protein